MARKGGKRKERSSKSNKQKPRLEYYIIVTDTEKTEKYYIDGFKKSLPLDLQKKIVIKVVKEETCKLVECAKNEASQHHSYAQPWIMFDRDEVRDFNNIIKTANLENIKVAWSNPCIEIWFCAYFGIMPSRDNSKSCLKEFKKTFRKHTNKNYSKNDKQIYDVLTKFGNEEKAIELANSRYEEQSKTYKKASSMLSTTTVHKLIEEIRKKDPYS